ncbi:MAG: hypothetical protein JNK67_15900 [Alphaproteobacteria bacterium]|nr:hypothetical protein [Alphaproteobacteria bacterium]
MAMVRMRAPAPFNEILVNSELVFCVHALPGAATPSSKLLTDGNRAIEITEPVPVVIAKLGSSFRRLPSASHTEIFVNRGLILNVVPNHDVPGTCFVHGLAQASRLPVAATLSQVEQALA